MKVEKAVARHDRISMVGRSKSDLRTQFGALCWRMKKGELQVCLITSRNTKRWIIPKGWPMHNRTPSEAAAIEAWEEAGLKGDISEKEIGSYTYVKLLSRKSAVCNVYVYPMHVTKVCDTWPEDHERKRKWFPAKKAARKVDDKAVQEIIRAFRKTAH